MISKAFFQKLMDIFEQIDSWNSSLETIILPLIKENQTLHYMLFFNNKMVSTIFIYLGCELLFFFPKTQSRLVFLEGGDEIKQCKAIMWNFLCAEKENNLVYWAISNKAKERCRWQDILSWISYNSPFPISRGPLSSETSL